MKTELSSEIRPSLSWGMIFLSLFALLSVGRVAEPFPFLWPLRLILVTGSLAAIAWILAPGPFSDKIPLKIRQMRYVIFLMLLAVASIPLSVWPGASFKGVSEGLWKLVLFFVLVCYWCRSLHDARRLIWMCCLGLSCLVLISRITGQTDAMSSQERFSGNSTIYDPNDLALILAMVIPLLVFLFATARRIMKLVIAGMGASALYGLILTQSRGGFSSGCSNRFASLSYEITSITQVHHRWSGLLDLDHCGRNSILGPHEHNLESENRIR